MKCPHCLVEFQADRFDEYIGQDPDGRWGVTWRRCPNPDCKRLIVSLVKGKWTNTPGGRVPEPIDQEMLVRPRVAGRPPVPPKVPEEFAADYREACLVLVDSPKASAALSRRALQHILRETAGAKGKSLAEEIREVVNSGQLPSYLAESLDGVRNIGNFAAHPLKSESSGEIVPVEVGEAEWNLDTIEALFDFYFVQPAKLQAKRDALNAKLKDAGKPEME